MLQNWKMHCLQALLCIFQPGTFTGCGREGVKSTDNTLITTYPCQRALFIIKSTDKTIPSPTTAKSQTSFHKAHDAWCSEEYNKTLVRGRVSKITTAHNTKTVLTALFSKSILLPMTTKGKFSGSRGLAWIRNSSLQLSRERKVFGMVTSNTRTQQSAPR